MTSRLDVSSLGAYIREQREAAEVSLRQPAKASGVSNPYLSQVERGLRRPSAEILGQIAKALRISAETLYVQAGLLEERPDDDTGGVPAAIAADPSLTDRQRGLLLEIYASFQAENAAGPRPTPTDPEGGAEAETPSRRSSSRPADRPVAATRRSRRPA